VRLRGVIEAAGRGGTAVPLPFDPKAVFGKARAPIRGTVNGAPFRSTVAIYDGVGYLGVTKALREAAGAEIGDEVDIDVDLDDAPREVDVPPELAAILERDRKAARAFEKLSYTHRREYARWIAEAKRAETKQRRVAKAAEMLRKGIRTPDAS
jgi:bifunctional DNA-binding transcriptional regulator/antitoxin component of YhaV-PrlF toxin-antitoxin module